MRGLMVKFNKILLLELEELEAELETLVTGEEKRFSEHEETERVYRENVATLSNEETGIRHFIRLLEGLDIDNYDNLDHLIAYIRAQFRRETKRCGFARATYLLVDRKIAKVETYVKDSDRFMDLEQNGTYAAEG